MSARHQATSAGRVLREGLDYAPTHPWAVRALCEQLEALGERLDRETCREPACGEGHMARALAESFGSVLASDIHDYGRGYRVADYLKGRRLARTRWTITNPPFNEAGVENFAHVALDRSTAGVALLAPLRFAETHGRYARLFAATPPTEILQFVERVPLLMGRLDPEASSATCYTWFVWRKRLIGKGTQFKWIPPCSHRLKRASDYV